jgi:hypothetical protein
MNKNNLPDNQSNFLLYTGNDGDVNVEVFLKDEMVWLTQKAIGELFGKERSVITTHIKNIFASGKLDEKSNVQKMHFTHFDKEKKLDELATTEDFSVVHFDKEMQRISGIKDDKK